MDGNIAIIPARGGSKRLSRKNILEFLGQPIIHYTIEAAQKSGLFQMIVVSTEDDEIAKCVAPTGCIIHWRSSHLATDKARVVHVLRDLLLEYQKKSGLQFEYLCCLYPTAPLRDETDICKSYELLITSRADFCLAVSQYDYSPFFAFNIDDALRIQRRWPEIFKLPSWEKPRVVVDNGSIYWAQVSAFLSIGELEGENSVGYLMPRRKGIDIDTEEDFQLAEYFAKTYLK